MIHFATLSLAKDVSANAGNGAWGLAKSSINFR